MNLDRRQILAAAAALAAPKAGWAFGQGSVVDIAQLDLGPGSVQRPDAWVRLLYEVIQSTAVDCVARADRVDPSSDELFRHPFSVLAGDAAFAAPSPQVMQQLDRYLSYGGSLFIDDTSGAERSGFDDSVRAMCAALFPTRPLAPIPSDHSVYRAFFLLDRAWGRVDRVSWLEGVTVGNFTPVVYCRNDLSGALDRGPDGRERQACVPGGERQRREAVKLGVNLILYALTTNYKADQTHVRQLMLEGRLE